MSNVPPALNSWGLQYILIDANNLQDTHCQDPLLYVTYTVLQLLYYIFPKKY